MVLIVCEGTKTETIYFNSLIAYEKLSSVNVQVFAGERSTPSMVVKTAIKIKEAQKPLMKYIVSLTEIHIIASKRQNNSLIKTISP
ncbi:RloB domain-containing protein [Gallibacterium anatis]